MANDAFNQLQASFEAAKTEQQKRALRQQFESVLRDPSAGGKWKRAVTSYAQQLDQQLAPMNRSNAVNQQISPLTGLQSQLGLLKDKGYAGADYDPSKDAMLQNLMSQAQSGSDDAKAQLDQYVSSQYGKLSGINERAQAEAGITGAYDEAAKGTFEMAQPILQQELARLGILNGGALSANTQQMAQQQAISRGQQLGAYRAGGAEGMQALTAQQMDSISNLRNQQRAQNVASFMQNAQNNAQRHQADRMLPWQIGGQVFNGLTSRGGGIWGK